MRGTDSVASAEAFVLREKRGRDLNSARISSDRQNHHNDLERGEMQFRKDDLKLKPIWRSEVGNRKVQK